MSTTHTRSYNKQEVLKLNFIRNFGNIGAEELIGRAKIRLKDICAKPGVEEVVKAALGREEFSNFEGCVRTTGGVLCALKCNCGLD